MKIKIQPQMLWKSHNTGFTLMEVLIAMAIGLVVLVGALSYFGKGVRALHTQDGYARLHESASRAASIISRDLQLAGFYGFGGAANESNIIGTEGYTFSIRTFMPAHPDIVDSGGSNIFSAGDFPVLCGDAGVLVDLEQPIEFYLGGGNLATSTTGNIDEDCFPDRNFDEPVLVVRGALEGEMHEPVGINDPIVTGANVYGANRLMVTANSYSGSNVPSVIYFFGNPATFNPQRLEDAPDYTYARAFEAGLIGSRKSGSRLPIFPYSFRAYYIRTCSDINVANCPTGVNVNGEPTLSRQQLTPGANEATVGLQLVSMIPGIESMRFFWGVDNRGYLDPITQRDLPDGVTDFWTEDPDNFSQVNIARIQLLVRAPTVDPSYNDADNHYYFDEDTVGFTCVGQADPRSCSFRRMIYETATSVRNCSLRRRAGTIGLDDC